MVNSKPATGCINTKLYPGGYPKFISQGFNENYLPVWLQQEGYNTYYTGKLFNVHTVTNYDSPHAAGFTGTVRLLHFQYPWLISTNHSRNSSLIHSHTITSTAHFNETKTNP